jgi:hypothetical protein
VSAVFDLDAAVSEADREPFRFSFGGEDFEIAPVVDVRVQVRASERDLYGALSMFLGEEQYKRLDKVDKPFTMDHLRKLMEAHVAHCGENPGE